MAFSFFWNDADIKLLSFYWRILCQYPYRILIYGFLFVFVSSLSLFGSGTLGLLEWVKKLSHLLSSREGFEERFVFGQLPISVSWTSSVRKEECLLMQFFNKKWPKVTWGEKGLFQLFHITVHHWGKGRHILKAGAQRQELMRRAWRSASYWLAPRAPTQPAFLYIQYRQPRVATAHNASQACPQASLTEPFSQLRLLLPKWLQLVSS